MLKNLKDLRKEFGYSQMQVAKMLNISQQTYSDYENCKTEPTTDTLLQMAICFGVTVDELLGRESNVAPMGDSLNAKERELLETFRQLSPYLQGLTLDTVRSFAGNSGDGLHKKA